MLKTYEINLVHKNGTRIFFSKVCIVLELIDTSYTIFCSIFSHPVKRTNPAICYCYVNTEGRLIYETFLLSLALFFFIYLTCIAKELRFHLLIHFQLLKFRIWICSFVLWIGFSLQCTILVYTFFILFGLFYTFFICLYIFVYF